MNRITCDICGTIYADTAPCCPICGSTRDYDDGIAMEELLTEEPERTGRRKEIFDFDEVNSESYPDTSELYPQTYTVEDEEEETESGPSTWVVILLTVLIVSLLAAAAFIFLRFYLPGRKTASPAPTATAEQTLPAQTEQTQHSVPCEELVMSSGASVQLSAQGQHFLLHVQAKPEDTTDRIIYTSGNEAVATVSDDGRITAVSEGETIIYIACGVRTLECPVTVRYVEDTTPPEIEITPPVSITAEDVVPEETRETMTLPAETTAQNPEETTAETGASAKNDVILKLKKTDVRLAAYRQFTLELDCDLKPEDVQWSSEHTFIATVDEKGLVTSVSTGTTVITAKYGDQTAQCIVRCVSMG